MVLFELCGSEWSEDLPFLQIVGGERSASSNRRLVSEAHSCPRLATALFSCFQRFQTGLDSYPTGNGTEETVVEVPFPSEKRTHGRLGVCRSTSALSLTDHPMTLLRRAREICSRIVKRCVAGRACVSLRSSLSALALPTKMHSFENAVVFYLRQLVHSVSMQYIFARLTSRETLGVMLRHYEVKNLQLGFAAWRNRFQQFVFVLLLPKDSQHSQKTMTITMWQALFVFLALCISLTSASTCTEQQEAPPFVSAESWLPTSTDFSENEIRTWNDVVACCMPAEESCVADGAAMPLKTAVIGKMPQFSSDDALKVLHTSVEAWNGGAGVWPQMSLAERCHAVQAFFDEFIQNKDKMVEVLMWEIGKNRKDAEAEIDRTVQFAKQLIATIQSDAEYSGEWQTIGSTKALVRRSAIGVIMCLAPYNYPINESYATIIPALLTGNIILVKIPTTGGLAHLLTMEAFAKTLPPGTINFIAGAGRTTMPPLMETGLIDGLAFIGGSKAADRLIHGHPHPHRLKVFLQLEANNMGILLPDIFEPENTPLLENALDEAVLGSLSYNGQRCTALKIFFAPTRHAESFAKRLAGWIDALPVGLPWQTHGEEQILSKITPLPNQKRIQYMKSLLQDAVQKGANIINLNGGTVIEGNESTLMIPAVLYPVTPEMNIYHEEQFGPIVPVAEYDDLETVLKFGQEGQYAQQVSIFSQDAKMSAQILDRFSSVFAKVNLNSQCGRSPDSLPFAGRRSSAMGVMSVKDALREFSVPTVLAYKDKSGVKNDELAKGLQEESIFLQPVVSEGSQAEK